MWSLSGSHFVSFLVAMLPSPSCLSLCGTVILNFKNLILAETYFHMTASQNSSSESHFLKEPSMGSEPPAPDEESPPQLRAAELAA